MELRVENAYYRDGLPKHGIEGYLGTETAHLQVRQRRGLRLISTESVVKQPPHDQLPVQFLIPVSQRGFRSYRYYYQVVFNRRGNIHGSVLIGAASRSEMEHLAEQLMADPESVCGAGASHCTVFPEMCTVSIDLEITVNGAPRAVPSGTTLATVTPGATHVQLLRRSGGRLSPVKVVPGSRIALYPGDQIKWDSVK